MHVLYKPSDTTSTKCNADRNQDFCDESGMKSYYSVIVPNYFMESHTNIEGADFLDATHSNFSKDVHK